eukprot:CAMPEP_0172723758 /NCGR_PEP_ID=MMETSP1074-20121228/84406_1 /TAXON_ID=2916 /ORGANISM="Ceratium fusus, Strain PA161109" /LENGTH=315 /DNA_ID=CAMNT_0013550053 /DNA_START=131 /DNA_END=1078 /DNA_ORIENTATION=-
MRLALDKRNPRADDFQGAPVESELSGPFEQDGTRNVASLFEQHREQWRKPKLNGTAITCDDDSYKLGAKIAGGMQATVYEVIGHPDKVAKVEHGLGLSSGYKLDAQECARAHSVKGAGVRTPDCFGVCKVDTTANGSSIAMLLERVPGHPILRFDEKGNVKLGEYLSKMQLADGTCSLGEISLPYEMWRQFFKMIRAGFANADQHIANMMLGNDGKVWFIDFGLTAMPKGGLTLWAEKAKSTEDTWNSVVKRMVRVVTKATSTVSKYDSCVDPVQTLHHKWFGEQLNTLDPKDKSLVCNYFKDSRATIGVCVSRA